MAVVIPQPAAPKLDDVLARGKTTEYPAIFDTVDAYLGPTLYTSPVVQNIFGSNMSCGVSFLSGVSYESPANIVHKVLVERHRTDRKLIREAFVIFSDVADRGGNPSGKRLAEYIRANNLGALIETEGRMNPNSGNIIKVWVWSPPHKSLDPTNRNMPVKGTVMRTDDYGAFKYYEEDERFTGGVPSNRADPRFKLRGA